MRKSYSFYSLLTLSSVFLFGNCSIIAEVDRTKIPQDGGQPEGGENQGGSAGSRGGTGGTRGGSGGAAGAGDGGMGGEAGGDTGGTSGTGGDAGAGMGGDMGGAGMGGAGDGGTGGSPEPGCGDGTVDTGETCDDGDMPPMSNDGCSATCQEEAGWDCDTNEPTVCTPVCGDGIVVTGEACDDGNSLSCGTCAGNAQGTVAGCTTAVAPAAATGSITTVAFSALRDGTTFTLNDGYSAATTFEFDSDNTATGTPIDIVTGVTDDATLQAAIIAAINGVGDTLRITASAGTAPAVILTHDRMTSAGNVAITKGGTDSGNDVTAAGMAGGLAGDCLATEPCASDADCKSLDCNSTNQCAAP
jgi:cysteine-rich repeat protein